jgi:hypothetical protein
MKKLAIRPRMSLSLTERGLTKLMPSRIFPATLFRNMTTSTWLTEIAIVSVYAVSDFPLCNYIGTIAYQPQARPSSGLTEMRAVCRTVYTA